MLLSEIDPAPLDQLRCLLPDQPAYQVLAVGRRDGQAEWWVIRPVGGGYSYCFDRQYQLPIWQKEQQ